VHFIYLLLFINLHKVWAKRFKLSVFLRCSRNEGLWGLISWLSREYLSAALTFLSHVCTGPRRSKTGVANSLGLHPPYLSRRITLQRTIDLFCDRHCWIPNGKRARMARAGRFSLRHTLWPKEMTVIENFFAGWNGT
jgi:hypothetical protein